MRLESKYSIGDTVYLPRAGHQTVQVPCPDCCGLRAWWVWMPSGEQLAITCPTCMHGYESRGTVGEYVAEGSVRTMTIGSVRTDSSAEPERQVEYMCEETGVGSGTIWRESMLYDTREEAEAVLPGLIEEARIGLEETRARSCTKRRVKDPGSMVAYYRAQIRSAKKDIAAAERGLAREHKGVTAREGLGS